MVKINIHATEWIPPRNYGDRSEFRCPSCGNDLTVGEYEYIGTCSSCYEEELSTQNNIDPTGSKMKTLQQEIVEALKEASIDYRAQAMACCAGILPRRFYEENKDKAERMEILAAKVESARCENCHWFNIVKPTCCDNPKNDNGFDDGAWIEANGPEFFCWHFEPKEK